MTQNSELIALAERCEAASGVDRELDAAIGRAVLRSDRAFIKAQMPAYTASLDAAMTLVPEGWDWETGRYAIDLHKATVWPRGYYDETEPHFAATPALALCAAALRARAAQ